MSDVPATRVKKRGRPAGSNLTQYFDCVPGAEGVVEYLCKCCHQQFPQKAAYKHVEKAMTRSCKSQAVNRQQDRRSMQDGHALSELGAYTAGGAIAFDSNMQLERAAPDAGHTRELESDCQVLQTDQRVKLCL